MTQRITDTGYRITGAARRRLHGIILHPRGEPALPRQFRWVGATDTEIEMLKELVTSVADIIGLTIYFSIAIWLLV